MVSNIELCERSRREPVSSFIQKQRLKWFGHICRMQRERIPKQAMFEWEPPNEKPRLGRPKITWKHTIERDLKNVEQPWERARMVAQDRCRWLKVVDTIAAHMVPGTIDR